MVDVFTTTTTWANLVAAAYDTFVRYQLRSRPVWRQFVDVHPVAPTIPRAPSVTLNIMQEYAALATTPLTENVDVSAVAPPAPVQVTVSVNEYGNSDLVTLRLKDLAYAQVDPIVGNLLGKNMLDTIDKLVQTTADTGTNALWTRNSAVQSTTAEATMVQAATDYITATSIRNATSVLRRRNAIPYDNAGNFVGLVHPDIANDIMGDSSWVDPHRYVDTANIYNGEIGTYMGVRFMSTPRTFINLTGGAGTIHVYRTYVLGKEALVEAMIRDGGIVIGNQTDKLKRFFPIGWYADLGWAFFRQEDAQQIRSVSSIVAL